MSTDTEARARRRAEIARVLARYPHLEPDARRELADWFEQEASSFDIAMLACNDSIADQYRSYRAKHIDPLRPRDWVRGLALVAAFVAALAAILWRAF